MDVQRTNNARLQNTLREVDDISSTELEVQDMPAPPAYHSIVNPSLALPNNMRNPYEAEENEEEEEELEEAMAEITINAATQVRGNVNIISIAQMDSARIAELISTIVRSTTTAEERHTLPSLASMTKPQLLPHTKVNITVNCGATVIGDRNIVGPGLGDIARQMQIAQRNQGAARAAAAAAASSVQLGEQTVRAQATMAPGHGGSATQTATPPMSRSGSSQSSGENGKRKAEEGSEESVKRRCC